MQKRDIQSEIKTRVEKFSTIKTKLNVVHQNGCVNERLYNEINSLVSTYEGMAKSISNYYAKTSDDLIKTAETIVRVGIKGEKLLETVFGVSSRDVADFERDTNTELEVILKGLNLLEKGNIKEFKDTELFQQLYEINYY